MGIRNKEHRINGRLSQTEKSTVAEHAEGNNGILFGEVKLFALAFEYHSYLVREEIEINKQTDNFNREKKKH